MREKNIIITGGTDGIGLALTKRLLKDEFNRVIIIGKNETAFNLLTVLYVFFKRMSLVYFLLF